MAVLKRNNAPLVNIILFTAIIFFGYTQFQNVITSEVSEQETVVIIPSNASTSEIANLLYDKKIVSNPFLFKLYARISGFESKLQAGEYKFSGHVSLKDIKEKLTTGQVVYIKFTIPEGYTVEQIANLLEKKGLIDKEKFFDCINSESFSYEYLPPPGSEGRLEGFLFPDTYKIAKGFSEKQIIELMLARFDEVFIDEWHQRVEELDMSVLEIVTLASIIEREAKIESDRPIISSVFHNRIKKGMYLESCATIQYALGEVKDVLLYEDLAIESPYNTYKSAGLPPGPIAACGKAALKAALYPEATKYLFFVAKKDGSHYFSKTLAEHNTAKRKYLK